MSLYSYKRTVFIPLLFLILHAHFAYAEEPRQDIQSNLSAKVIHVLTTGERNIPGTNAITRFQTLEIEIQEGEQKGTTIILDNDYINLAQGDTIFLNSITAENGKSIYSIQEVDRRWMLLLWSCLFVAIVLIFTGKKGIRSLLSLAGGFLIIFYFLLPQLLKGAEPVSYSIFFSILIILFAIYLTHGCNREATAALFGTITTIIFTVLLAQLAVSTAHLSGYGSDETSYLNLGSGGRLDIQGLLLASIIIGTLGALYDIAITQASAVTELQNAAPHLTQKEIYVKTLRIGKEHLGAAINTLALAYTGAALPLLLLFYGSSASIPMIANREVFATEIIRTIVGSIGIILTVPITTWIATILLVKKQDTHKTAQTI